MTEKLGTIAAVEETVNEFARGVARKIGLRPDIFRIHLMQSLKRGHCEIIGGPTVQIQLLWPMDFAKAGATIRTALLFIKRRPGVWTPLALATHSFYVQEQEAITKWKREKLGTELSDTIEELIPRHRIKVTRTVTTRYEDMVTGEALTVTQEHSPEPYRENEITTWLMLSRQVHERHPSTNATSSTEQAAEDSGNTPDQPAESGAGIPDGDGGSSVESSANVADGLARSIAPSYIGARPVELSHIVYTGELNPAAFEVHRG